MSLEIPRMLLCLQILLDLLCTLCWFSKLSTFFHETCFSPFACPSVFVLSFCSHSGSCFLGGAKDPIRWMMTLTMDASMMVDGREICMLWAKGSSGSIICLVMDVMAVTTITATKQ